MLIYGQKPMIQLSNITGRLGNQMFLFAFAYNQAKKLGVDRYFQDPEYFKDSQADIKAIFGQNVPPKMDMVAIHYRQTDYIGHDFYVNLSETDYYQKAMDLFPSDTKFLVFSDEPE